MVVFMEITSHFAPCQLARPTRPRCSVAPLAFQVPTLPIRKLAVVNCCLLSLVPPWYSGTNGIAAKIWLVGLTLSLEWIAYRLAPRASSLMGRIGIGAK